MIPEGEVHVLEVPVPAMSGPLLVHRGVAVSAAHVQLKLAVSGGALVRDDEGRDTDFEGEETGGVVRVRPHFTVLTWQVGKGQMKCKHFSTALRSLCTVAIVV